MRRFEFWAQRNGANYRQLQVPDDDTPTVTWTGDAKIKRTASLRCAVDRDIDWLTDLLSVQMLGDDLGQPVPLGLFYVTTAPEKEGEDGQRYWNLTGYDLAYSLSNLGVLEHPLTVLAGTKYTDAISAQLVSAGVTRLRITASKEILPIAKEFETGTSLYEIVETLRQDINYRALWFDGDGTAVMEPWAPATVSARAHVYEVRPGECILRGGLDKNEDTFDAANVFISIVDSPDISTELRAEAVNDYNDSPLSVQRRGRRIPEVQYLDSIASLDALHTHANNRKILSMMSSTVYTFYTDSISESEHGLNDAIILQRDDIGLLEEQDWSIECTPAGLMTHTAREVFYNV